MTLKPDMRDDDLEPDVPWRDCPWKCAPNHRVCLCRQGRPLAALNLWRTGRIDDEQADK